MNIVSEFTILCLGQHRMTFDSPIPSFCVLSLISDMEKQGTLKLNSDGEITVFNCSNTYAHSNKLLTDIIIKNRLTSIQDILNHFLRCLTFKELKTVTDAITEEICKSNKNIVLHKGKLCINDDVLHKSTINLTSMLINDNDNKEGITLAAFLYGCRMLSKYLDKNEHRSTVAVIKEGVHISHLPLTSFIVNNIDLIRGHIIGIVAN